MKPDLVGAQCRWLIAYIEKRIAVSGEHEIGARGPRAELILLRMDSRERANIEYDFLLYPRGILVAHDAWVLRPLGEAVLIDIAVVGCRDACILLRLKRIQFCGKLIDQRLDGLKLRVGIGVLRIEIRDDARVLAIAQPVVVIDAYTA